MIIPRIVLIPLLIISLLAFFKLSPQNPNPKKVKIYNLSTIMVAILLSIIYTAKVMAYMVGSSIWWPYIVFICSSTIMIGTIFISGIIRNFIIFRNKNR